MLLEGEREILIHPKLIVFMHFDAYFDICGAGKKVESFFAWLPKATLVCFGLHFF